jgi:hypothetical protein
MSEIPLQRKDKRSRIFWIQRTVILWLGGVLGFMLIDYLDVGLKVNSWETAFVVVALLGILNALFWPLLSRIFLPFMVFTVGLGSLLLWFFNMDNQQFCSRNNYWGISPNISSSRDNFNHHYFVIPSNFG